jgi:hypothetical protein
VACWVGVGGWFQVGRMTLLFFSSFLFPLLSGAGYFACLGVFGLMKVWGFIYVQKFIRIRVALCFFDGYKRQI